MAGIAHCSSTQHARCSHMPHTTEMPCDWWKPPCILGSWTSRTKTRPKTYKQFVISWWWFWSGHFWFRLVSRWLPDKFTFVPEVIVAQFIVARSYGNITNDTDKGANHTADHISLQIYIYISFTSRWTTSHEWWSLGHFVELALGHFIFKITTLIIVMI